MTVVAWSWFGNRFRENIGASVRRCPRPRSVIDRKEVAWRAPIGDRFRDMKKDPAEPTNRVLLRSTIHHHGKRPHTSRGSVPSKRSEQLSKGELNTIASAVPCQSAVDGKKGTSPGCLTKSPCIPATTGPVCPLRFQLAPSPWKRN